MTFRDRQSVLASFVALSFAAGVAPAQVNPLVAVRESRLLGSDAAIGDLCGKGLAVRGDLAVVGSPYADVAGEADAGAAYAFERTASGWVERQKLVASDGAAADRFAWSVAIVGGRICVGAPLADVGGVSDVGAVYVFEQLGAAWVERSKLVGIGADISEAMGWVLDGDGSTLVAGAVDDHHSGGAVTGGAAYVFVESGGAWTQQARLHGSDSVAFDYFGQALDLCGDVLVVGANGDNHPGFPGLSNGGSAYVFERANGTWTETAKIVPGDVDTGDLFGWSVAFDGATLAVGSVSDDAGTVADAGSVYLYDRVPGGFAFVQKLADAAAAPGASFGMSVAIAGDVLAVGAYFGDGSGVTRAGSAQIFERASGAFGPAFELRTTVVETMSGFGTALAFDGAHAIVGAVYDDTTVAGQDSGSAYVYRVERAVEAYCTAKVNGLGCTPALAWNGLPSASSAQPFVVTASNVLNRRSGLFVYAGAPSAAPFQGGLLCLAAPFCRTGFQSTGGSAVGDDCTGALTFDFNAYARSGTDPALSSGTEVFVQAWSRDPFSAIPSSLTDALRFWLGP